MENWGTGAYKSEKGPYTGYPDSRWVCLNCLNKDVLECDTFLKYIFVVVVTNAETLLWPQREEATELLCLRS